MKSNPNSILRIHTTAVAYGDDVCCQMCGRKNYPKQKDGKALEWSVEHSLFLVDPSLTEEPRPRNATILCDACLKEMIEEKYHANGTYAHYNDGTCADDVSKYGLIASLNLRSDKDLTLWLQRKYRRDSEYYSLKTGMEIALWLQSLWNSHLLYSGGVMCQDKCYGIMCEWLGLPFSEEEHAVSCVKPDLQFSPATEGTITTDTLKQPH